MTFNLLGQAQKRLHQISSVSNAVGTLMLFGLVAVLNVDVFARGALHSPLKGSVEIVIFALVLIVFLQLPDVIKCDRLTRSDGFITYAKHKYPTFASGLSRLIDFASSLFLGLIAYVVWPEFLETFESCSFFTQPEFGAPLTGIFLEDLSNAFARCEYFGTPGIFTAPTWPLHLATVFGAILSSLILFLKSVLGGSVSMHHSAGSETTLSKDSDYHDSR
jgi:TRAP-type C4-dicarboxylate transport system permease small subunit